MIKVANIGFGFHGQNHCADIDFISGQQVQLVAILGKTMKKSNFALQQYHCNNYYTNILKLLIETKPDICVIATPTNLLIKHSLLCIKHNVKFLLIEKPVASKYHSISNLQKIALRNNVEIRVGYSRRYQSVWHKIKEWINCNKIGKLQKIEISTTANFKQRFSKTASTFRSNPELRGGGVVLDNCSHFIDIILFLTNSIGIIKKAEIVYDQTDKIDIGAFIEISQPDIEILISAINADCNQNTSVIISGENGVVEVKNDLCLLKTANEVEDFRNFYLISPIEDILNLYYGEKSIGATLNDAKRTIEIIENIYNFEPK